MCRLQARIINKDMVNNALIGAVWAETIVYAVHVNLRFSVTIARVELLYKASDVKLVTGSAK